MDVYFYYISTYPILLIIGAFKRIKRRLKYLWLPKGPGRPPTPENIVDIILEMKRCNPSWGKKRIRDELLFLGIHLDKNTIQKILVENGMLPPKLKFQPPTWAYLYNSNKKIWSMDFTNIIDLNCFQLFFLVVIDVRSRELIYIGLTLNPSRGWLIQQFKNIAIDEIDFPHFLIIDNDGIYAKWIDPTFWEYFEIKTLRIDKGCPWQNGICERFMRTFKSDLLYRIPISDINYLYIIIQAYRNYYNRVRPHQGIKGNVPQNMKRRIERINNLADIKIKKVSHIYGLFTEFSLAA